MTGILETGSAKNVETAENQSSGASGVPGCANSGENPRDFDFAPARTALSFQSSTSTLMLELRSAERTDQASPVSAHLGGDDLAGGVNVHTARPQRAQ
jgi:hypothetical protein